MRTGWQTTMAWTRSRFSAAVTMSPRRRRCRSSALVQIRKQPSASGGSFPLGEGARSKTHQCPRRDPDRKTVLPGRVQAAALPGPGQRLLRMARGAGREAAVLHTHGGGGAVFLCGALVVLAGGGRAGGELRHHNDIGQGGTGRYSRP